MEGQLGPSSTESPALRASELPPEPTGRETQQRQALPPLEPSQKAHTWVGGRRPLAQPPTPMGGRNHQILSLPAVLLATVLNHWT